MLLVTVLVMKADAVAAVGSLGKMATPVCACPGADGPWLEEESMTEPRNGRAAGEQGS